MKKLFINFTILILLILFIPYFITALQNPASDTAENEISYDGRVVVIEDKNIEQSIDYSLYLHGMVARMMISFDNAAMQYDELIKLCCVISNTLTHVLSEELLGEYYISEDDLKIYWNDKYDEYHNKILQNIEAVKNQVITYNDAVFTPFYHLISPGMTRTFDDTSKYPYIKSVNTNKDLEENSFLAVNRFTSDEFINIINNYYEEAVLNDSGTELKEKIQITGRDSVGCVTSLKLGDMDLSGDEFVEIFSLNSPCFTITCYENSLKIITKGIGHGYGISLAYALRMAMDGESCEAIIDYFYDDVEIKKIDS
jgi:stage II sporulation protein D